MSAAIADRRATLAADVVAGVSMAGLLLPEAVAYSGIAGMPPQAGVLALFAGLLVYGFIGRSRFAVVSATSSSAAVLGAATLAMAGHDAALRVALAAGLVLATGLAFLAAGAMRLGGICSFISKPVLRGFSFGLALVIIVKQLPKLTGAHATADTTLGMAWQLLAQVPQWNWAAFALGAIALAALAFAKRLPRLPGALLVIAAGIGAAQVLQLGARGVAVVGHIDLAIASPTLPRLTQGPVDEPRRAVARAGAARVRRELRRDPHDGVEARRRGRCQSRPARARRLEPRGRPRQRPARGRRILGHRGQRSGRRGEPFRRVDRGRRGARAGGVVLALDRAHARAGAGRGGDPRGLAHAVAGRLPAVFRRGVAIASPWWPRRCWCWCSAC